VSAVPQDPTAADAALSAAAARLADLADLAVADSPFADLQAALHHATATLHELGPDACGTAALLGRRAEYLADAAALLRTELTRLAVARAAPTESDLSVQIARSRDAVGYLAEIAADLLPARTCRSIGTDLAAHPAPTVVRVLQGLRGVCDLAEQVTTRAVVALGGPSGPTGAPVGPPAWAALRERRGDLDRLIAALTI
jgi:hypothetical protein